MWGKIKPNKQPCNDSSSLTTNTEDRDRTATASPKIAKSFRSRITLGLRSPPKLLTERDNNDNNEKGRDWWQKIMTAFFGS